MFKNLPKALLAAAAGVLDESAKNRQAHYRNVVKSALEQFKVQSFTQLSEIEQRIFSEWVVQRLDEEGHVHTESCGCGEEEDLLHKQAKVNAHSGLPELGEEDEKELDEADEDDSEKEVNEEDEEDKFKKEDDIPGQDDSAFHKARNEEDEKELDEEDEEETSTNLKESVGSVSQVVWTSGAEEGKALLQVPKGEFDKNPDSSSLKTLQIKVRAAKALTKLSADRNTIKVAGGAKEGEYYLVKVEFTTRQGLQREDYASPEPSSAIGHRIGVESPKHADVIKDTSLQTGDQFRLMLQFVNGWPEFIPPVSLPGAPSIEALGELVAEYDDDNGVISKALADALDVPSERPAHRGNDLSESKKSRTSHTRTKAQPRYRAK